MSKWFNDRAIASANSKVNAMISSGAVKSGQYSRSQLFGAAMQTEYGTRSSHSNDFVLGSDWQKMSSAGSNYSKYGSKTSRY